MILPTGPQLSSTDRAVFPSETAIAPNARFLSAHSHQYRYGFESGNAFLIRSTRGFASSVTITSATSKRKRISGLSSIRSHARAPREIRFRLSRSTASNGRPKSSLRRVFTSTKTSVSLSRQTTSISPPVRPRKLRKRIL